MEKLRGKIIPFNRLRIKQLKKDALDRSPLVPIHDSHSELRPHSSTDYYLIECAQPGSKQAMVLLEKMLDVKPTAIILEDSCVPSPEQEFAKMVGEEFGVPVHEAVFNPMNAAIAKSAGISEKDAILAFCVRSLSSTTAEEYTSYLNSISIRFNVDLYAMQQQLNYLESTAETNRYLYVKYTILYNTIKKMAAELTWHHVEQLGLSGKVIVLANKPQSHIFYCDYQPKTIFTKDEKLSHISAAKHSRQAVEAFSHPRLYSETLALFRETAEFESRYKALLSQLEVFPNDEFTLKKIHVLLQNEFSLSIDQHQFEYALAVADLQVQANHPLAEGNVLFALANFSQYAEEAQRPLLTARARLLLAALQGDFFTGI